MISTNEKVEIFEAAKATMKEWYSDQSPDDQGRCLYWTQVAMRELHYRGHRVILQAGTMMWQIAPPGTAVADAFGYEWCPEDPGSQAQIAKGELPELHIWAALPDLGEIVDFSTGHLPHIAKKYFGFDWLTPYPPEYIFGPTPPPGCLYRPIPEATRFAINFINEKVLA